MYHNEELDAKFNGLLNTTASRDAISYIELKLDILIRC
jgi:hypothetical protein